MNSSERGKYIEKKAYGEKEKTEQMIEAGGEKRCLFPEATERHLSRPLDQGDLQTQSIQVTLVLV